MLRYLRRFLPTTRRFLDHHRLPVPPHYFNTKTGYILPHTSIPSSRSHNNTKHSEWRCLNCRETWSADTRDRDMWCPACSSEDVQELDPDTLMPLEH